MTKERFCVFICGILLFISGVFVGSLLTTGENSVSLKRTTSSLPTTTIGTMTEIVFPLVAVTSNEEGVLEYGILKIIHGSGKAYISINPFVEPDTQYALENAIKAACKLAKKDCSKYDFILTIHSNATLVGGPSAGLPFALAVYYGLLNKSFPPYIAATGTIDSEGRIGPVGGVFEKALAAAKAGKRLFIIPPEQSIVYSYEKVEKRYEPFPGFVFVQIEYRPVPINLTKLFWEKYKMRIEEVRTLEEAIKIINSYYKIQLNDKKA